MCYERRYYDSQTAASQAKQQDRKREELVKGLLRDAEKAGEKTNENKIPSKEPAPAK